MTYLIHESIFMDGSSITADDKAWGLDDGCAYEGSGTWLRQPPVPECRRSKSWSAEVFLPLAMLGVSMTGARMRVLVLGCDNRQFPSAVSLKSWPRECLSSGEGIFIAQPTMSAG